MRKKKAKLEAFEDPNDPGNSPVHHTGKLCVEKGCDRPAGTAWSPMWCHPCNVVRMRRISASLGSMTRRESLVSAMADIIRKHKGSVRLANPAVANPYPFPAEDEPPEPPEASEKSA